MLRVLSVAFIIYLIVSEMLSNLDCAQSNFYSELFLNYESLRPLHKKKRKKHQI